MNISQVGINLIKSFEGISLKAYQDSGGIWSIGYGHIMGVHEGQEITLQQAEQFLLDDLKGAVATVNTVKVPLNQNQFDALVSFTFNVGNTAFETSTLLQLLNKHDYSDASDELLKWNHVHGNVVGGLTNRRKSEKALFDKPVPVVPVIVNYTIKNGDTLSGIAQAKKTTVDKIMKLNPSIFNPNKIRVGQVIKIPN